MSTETATASRQRGFILLEQSRYPEASRYFREALAQDPHDFDALYHLAVCEWQQGEGKTALATVERAMALQPQEERCHALRSFILASLDQLDPAQQAAQTALELNPSSDFAFTAQANVYLRRNEWSKAEASAREALAINPENASASHQLATALRMQNRLQESEEQIRYQLGQDPENSYTHANAGWAALQRGKQKEAEKHFLEALRLDADNAGAKDGLKEAFKARSPLYRAYLAYCFFMQRFTEGRQWLIFIGFIVVMKLSQAFLPAPLAFGVTILYLLFVLWVHVARSVGNLQLLFDRFARYALNRAEWADAIFVGGAVVVGLPLIVLGISLSQKLLYLPGITLIGASFPLAHFFLNRSVPGRILFGASGVFILGAGAAITGVLAFTGKIPDWSATLSTAGFLTVIAVTWLCNVPALRK